MNDNTLSRLIQIGTVHAVNSAGTHARVRHQDTGITSDWLRILTRKPAVIVESGYGPDEHSHNVTVTDWIPNVNDTVLVIYLPVDDSDGFVIGGL